jgi:hypothetical protein
MRPVLAYQLADHASSWTRMVLSPRIRRVCHKKPMVKLRRRSSLGVQVFILYDALGIRWELGGLQHPHTPRPPRIQLPGRISRQAENRYSEGHGNGHLLADGRLPCRLCWTSPPRSTAIARGGFACWHSDRAILSTSGVNPKELLFKAGASLRLGVQVFVVVPWALLQVQKKCVWRAEEPGIFTTWYKSVFQ